MKSFFFTIKSLAKGLFLPVGSLSKELAIYDPVDKPILRYESLLFWNSLSLSLLGKAIIKLSLLDIHWAFILCTFILMVLATEMFLSFYHLLIPPRFSGSRIAIITISIIMVLMLLSKN